MINRNDLITELCKDRVRNINLLNFLKDYPVVSIDQVGESYLVRGTSDHTWVYISSTNPDEFTQLNEQLSDADEYFAIIEDWMLPQLLANKSLIWKLFCMKLYFPAEEQLPAVAFHPTDNVEVVALTPEWGSYIFDHSKYKDFTSIEYIIERIQLGVALAIFLEGKPVAWLLTHDDGAMGFLHVLPEYRGRRLAQLLIFEMIKRLRVLGELPFVHIEEDNIQSMSLAKKMGFRAERRIHWFQRE